MAFAAVAGVLQLGVLGSVTRSVSVRTLLVAAASGSGFGLLEPIARYSRYGATVLHSATSGSPAGG